VSGYSLEPAPPANMIPFISLQHKNFRKSWKLKNLFIFI